MSPPGDVALATCSVRHNARRITLKNVSVQLPQDGGGGASHINAAAPGPQRAPGYLNDDSNGV